MQVFTLAYLVSFSSLASCFDHQISRFSTIQSGVGLIFIDPYSHPTYAMYFDPSRNSSHDYIKKSEISFHGINRDTEEFKEFKIGLSVLILEYTTSENEDSNIEVSMFLDDICINSETISDDIELPEKSYDPKGIFKSWEICEEEEFKDVRINMTFNNLNRDSKVYLVVTSYKVARNNSETKECEPYPWFGERTWWNCNIMETDLPPLCVNYKLTCDHLPHCAKEDIPNPDENCDNGLQLVQIFKLLIYTIVTICVVIFVAGCARCCLRGVARRHLLRRGSDLTEILAETMDPVRPENAPPTYEDAMKFVNDAFSLEEEEDNEEAPPTYSPSPREGEQSGFTFPPSDPVCSCRETGEYDGAPGFTDNFSSLDLSSISSLPRDPPPYVKNQ